MLVLLTFMTATATDRPLERTWSVLKRGLFMARLPTFALHATVDEKVGHHADGPPEGGRRVLTARL
jgi:hypothetical protein